MPRLAPFPCGQAAKPYGKLNTCFLGLTWLPGSAEQHSLRQLKRSTTNCIASSAEASERLICSQQAKPMLFGEEYRIDTNFAQGRAGG
jgi:hypothetical protein